MSNILKKTLGRVLAICLALTVLAGGCGKSGQPGDSTATGENTAGQSVESKAAEEKVELRYVVFNGNAKGRDADKVWAQFNSELEKVLPNTSVNFEIILSSEYKQRWDLMMAGGEHVDIAWAGYLVPFVPEVEKGSYMVLDELFEKYGQDVAKEVPEWYMDLGRVKGNLYAVPVYKDTVELRMGMYTPKELYDQYWEPEWNQVFYNSKAEYRRTTPEMYEVFEKYLEKLKSANEMRSGVSPMVWRMDSGYNMTFQFSPDYLRLPLRGQKWDLTVRNYYESEECKDLFAKMAEWFKKGYIRKDILSQQNPRAFENTTSGKEGNVMWFHTYFNDKEPTAEYTVFDQGDRWKNPAIQVGLEKDFYAVAKEPSAALVLPRTCKHPERAMQLINILNSKQGTDLFRTLNHGIEGVHYNIVDAQKNRIKGIPGEDPKNPAYQFQHFTIGNLANAPLTEDIGDNYYNYLFNDVNGKALVSPLLGFKPDMKDLTVEIAQCQAIVTEYRQTLMLGALGDDWSKKLDEFNKKLKAAGSEKIIAEMQKQIDEYIASKGLDKNNIIAE